MNEEDTRVADEEHDRRQYKTLKKQLKSLICVICFK